MCGCDAFRKAGARACDVDDRLYSVRTDAGLWILWCRIALFHSGFIKKSIDLEPLEFSAQMVGFLLRGSLARLLTFIKDSIKKSIDLELLELRARIVVFLLWGSVATRLTFIKDFIRRSIYFELLKVCYRMARFH